MQGGHDATRTLSATFCEVMFPYTNYVPTEFAKLTVYAAVTSLVGFLYLWGEAGHFMRAVQGGG
jgi:hypothetical protein